MAGAAMRVCFIGDSFVSGAGDDDALGWVGRVTALARRAGRDLTAYNLGVRRDTSADVAARWRVEAARRLPDDHDGRLVFSFGANDCVSGPDARPRVSRAESLANVDAIVREACAWRPTLMIGPSAIADDDGATDRIAALSRDYAALSARVGVPYLEVCSLTRASEIWRREALAGDGAHPNAGGYAALAAAVAAWPAWRAWLDP